MKQLLLLTFLLLLAGCGQDTTAPRTTAQPAPVDPEFIPYVSAFEQHYSVNASGTGISFAPQTSFPGTIIGYCDGKNVTIDSDYWAIAGDKERLLLVFHELGHCVLQHGHDKDLDPTTGCPLSVMNPYLPTEWCYNNNPGMLDTYRLNP